MIKKMFLVFLCFTLFLSMPGCKKKLPTTPDIPGAIDPTVQSIIVISNSDMLYIGVSEIFTATAVMSNGGTKVVIGGAWSGDNPSVATVGASTGEVTIVGSGMVNISVSYEGQQGVKAIRGLPDYQGTWSGTYHFTLCHNYGEWQGFCGDVVLYEELLIELNLTQEEDRVEGHFLFYQLGADASGPVQIDGQLLLAGAIQSGDFTIEVAMLLQSTVPGEITGHISEIWRSSSMSGSAELEANIQDLPRISSMAGTLGTSASQIPNPTLRDLVRALRRR